MLPQLITSIPFFHKWTFFAFYIYFFEGKFSSLNQNWRWENLRAAKIHSWMSLASFTKLRKGILLYFTSHKQLRGWLSITVLLLSLRLWIEITFSLSFPYCRRQTEERILLLLCGGKIYVKCHMFYVARLLSSVRIFK